MRVSAKAAAEVLGINVNTLTKRETNNSIFTPKDMQKFAEYLKIDINEMEVNANDLFPIIDNLYFKRELSKETRNKISKSRTKYIEDYKRNRGFKGFPHTKKEIEKYLKSNMK